MTTDIFIKTCLHDAEYHQHCIASIQKYCTGFRDTVVINGEHPQGYLHQQVVKLHADLHTDADFILMTDSDTLMTRPVTPETYMVDGKPIWIHTPWSEAMLAHAGTRKWFDVMTAFMGVEPPAEFMRRQGFMVPRWLLKGLRKFCVDRFGVTMEQYVMSKDSFSEFNIMGFYAWQFHREKFHWINSETDELPELTVHQCWSHDPISKNIEKIREILQ